MYCNFDATGVDESKRILTRLGIVLTNHVRLLHAQWALQEHSHQTLKFCGGADKEDASSRAVSTPCGSRSDTSGLEAARQTARQAYSPAFTYAC
jgi:hypothetical protein